MFLCKKRRKRTFVFLQELLQLEDRLGSVNRGAIQSTIERFTFPHKYKKVSVESVHLPVEEAVVWCPPVQRKDMSWGRTDRSEQSCWVRKSKWRDESGGKRSGLLQEFKGQSNFTLQINESELQHSQFKARDDSSCCLQIWTCYEFKKTAILHMTQILQEDWRKNICFFSGELDKVMFFFIFLIQPGLTLNPLWHKHSIL